MSRTIQIMRRLLLETPIDPGDRSLAGLKDLARFAWRYRGVHREFYEIFDSLTMSAHDFLSRWFESEEVKVLFGYWAAIGFFKGRSHSWHRVFDHVPPLRRKTGLGFSKGGMGAISEAIAASGRSHGMEIVTEAGSGEDRDQGWPRRLGSSPPMDASSTPGWSLPMLPPPSPFGRMVPRDELPEEFMDAIDGWHGNGRGVQDQRGGRPPAGLSRFHSGAGRCGIPFVCPCLPVHRLHGTRIR